MIAIMQALFVANEEEIDTTTIKWNKLRKGLPMGRAKGNDRAPTIEEIRKLVEYP